MILESVFVFLGVLVGILTGITPGIHINTVAAIIGGVGFGISPFIISLFLVALSVSHNFFDFIPSMLLSSPEESTSLASTPAQKLLLDGRIRHGLRLVSFGCLCGVLVCALFAPLLVEVTKFVYSNIRNYIPFILLGVSLHLVMKEKDVRGGLVIFFLSGVIGYFSLNMIEIKQVMLPLLSGFFGLPNLYKGLKEKIIIPEQKKFYGYDISKKEILRGGILGVFSSTLMGFLPSIGPTQASLLTEEVKKKSKDEFFVSLGAINTADVIMSLVALFSIGKPRSGALVLVKEIMEVGYKEMFWLACAGIASAFASFFIFNWMSNILADKMKKVNYRWMCTIMTVLLFGIILGFSGVRGILLALLCSLLGYYCDRKKVRKSTLMGCLVIPTIVFYLKIWG